MTVLNRPIKSLPSTDATGQKIQVAVTVVPMSRSLVNLWTTLVQPLIDQNYRHSAEGLPNAKVRADVGWNWRQNFLVSAAHGVVHSPSVALCLVVKQLGAPVFPIGMLTMVPQLNCQALGVTRPRGFAWYLADAPLEVYQQLLKVPAIKGVASALIDCSIQATLDATHDGTHLLHADPKGGIKLTEFYTKAGMVQLPVTNGPITKIFRRHKADEYFHFDDVQARAYCAKYDLRR